MNITTLIVPRTRDMYEKIVNILGKYNCRIANMRPYKTSLEFYDVSGIDVLEPIDKRTLYYELVAIEVSFLSRGIFMA